MGKLHEDVLRLKKYFEKSDNSDYRVQLYGGMRATLIFSPNCGLPNNEDINRLCSDIQPMVYTQLDCTWLRKGIDIPSTKLINVFGLRKS